MSLLPEFSKLIKLMQMTTSANDTEALLAVRKANEQMQKLGKSWEELLTSRLTIIADPFESLQAPPQRKTAPPPANHPPFTPSPPPPPTPQPQSSPRPQWTPPPYHPSYAKSKKQKAPSINEQIRRAKAMNGGRGAALDDLA